MASLLLVALCWGCSKQQSAPDPASRPVPVIAVAAAQRDVPIFLEGLGTVTALKTAVVRSQVDGRLQEVYFKEGQPVRRGELLAQVDPRPFQVQLQQAEGAQARDAALLRSTKLNLERYVTLKNERLVPQQQVDDQQAAVGQQEGALRIDQAQVNSARLNLEYARITAPIDGLTGIRQTDPGNLVHPTDAVGIVVITQIDPIAVIFTLSQDELPKVAPAMKAGPLPVEAWSREGQTHLGTGSLMLIDNQINQGTATIRLKASFLNADRMLWPNQFIKARLRLAVRKGALVIPVTAVQRGPKGTFVYVIGGDGKAEVRTIEIEQTAGDQVLLRSGVKPGEQVIVDGQNQLRPGSKVSARGAKQ